MSIHVTADRLREVRSAFCISMMEARDAIARAYGDERFGGDVALAVAYGHAKGLAINVKGDRDAWNFAYASGHKATMIANSPEIAAYVAAHGK